MKLPFDRKFLVASAVSVLSFAALTLIAEQSIDRVKTSLALIEHRNEVQAHTQRLFTGLLQMQASQRGYLLGAQPAQRDAFRQASQRLDRQLARLSELVADHREREPDHRRLLALIGEQRLAWSQALGESELGVALGADAARSGADDARMEEIDQLLARMAAEETRGLEAQIGSAGVGLDQSRRLAMVVASLAAMLLGAMYLLVRREKAASDRAEQAEANALVMLEQHVAERTREVQRAWAALRLSEQRLSAIFETTTDSVLVVDEEQRVVMANPAAASIFRCPHTQLVGAPLETFIPARHRERHQRHVTEFAQTGVSARHMGRRLEVSGLRCDGEEFPVDASISQVEVDGQRLYTVILRDISAARRDEAALRASESRLRRLLVMLPEAVFVSSRSGMSFVNQAAQRLTGLDEPALLGQTPPPGAHPDSVPMVMQRIGQRLQAGASATPLVEERIVRADGSLRTVEAMATQIDDRGESSLLVLMRDITEVKQMRSALEQSHADLQRLVSGQESVRENERRRIARELHDDLQQTLAAIKMDIGTALTRLAAQPGAVRPLLVDADELASAALESTRRIVNALRPQVLDDLGLVPALEALAQQFEQRTGIACLLETGDGGEDLLAPPDIATCLYRLAQEALNNVAKHAQANAVTLQLDSEGPELRLIVHDDGRGLSPGDLRKPQSVGLLGMQERVRALGGRLVVRADAAGGTTVQAALPVPQTAPAA